MVCMYAACHGAHSVLKEGTVSAGALVVGWGRLPRPKNIYRVPHYCSKNGCRLMMHGPRPMYNSRFKG